MTLPSENASLIAAVAFRRDKEAFTRLFDFFAPRINAYLQQLGTEPGLAEEITQDVMVTLWLKAGLFDPSKSGAATWLYRIARNRRVDYQRRDREKLHDPADRVLDLVDGECDDVDARIDLQAREERLRAALRGLPQEYQCLIRLAFFEGLSHAQVAACTGLPLGTVKSRLRLAFARLRKLLEDQGIAEAL